MDYRPSGQSSFLSSAAAHWAIPELEKKLAANPNDWQVLNNLGNAYFMCRKTELAAEFFERARDCAPQDNAIILSNLANVKEEMTKWELALGYAVAANKADPKDRYAAQVYAECLLRAGQWAMGWDLYEKCRFSIPQCPLKTLAQYMEHRTTLTDTRVLVLQEGGLGDVFLAFRFLRNLKEMGAHVTFAVDKRLHCLFERHPWVDKLLDAQGDKVTSTEYDCWVSSMSLIGMFAQTPLAAMAQWPGYYFSSGSERKRLTGSKLKVGLCWQAGEEQEYHKHRSLEEADVVRLLQNQDVDWVCLQWPYSTPVASPFTGMRAVDISDWEKTAEVIEDLDLVITVETGLMFLAAAIGTPTWVLLRNSFWYFLTRGTDCVWFPNMQLFRAQGLTYEAAVDSAALSLKLEAMGPPPGPPRPPKTRLRQFA